jgi:hypothetical protein
MNALLHRAIVLVSGQGDELDNPLPKRHLIPASVDADGKPTPLCLCAHVRRGGCQQWRRCPLLETEMASETAHDHSRTFSGMTAAEKGAARERKRNALIAHAQAIFWTVAVAALCAALMTGMRG